MHHPTDRITHTTTFVTPVAEHWLEREHLLNDAALTKHSFPLIVAVFPRQRAGDAVQQVHHTDEETARGRLHRHPHHRVHRRPRHRHRNEKPSEFT